MSGGAKRPDPVVTVGVGSRNPVKSQAVERAFAAIFPAWRLRVEALGVDSGVPDQPSSDAQTLAGARRRAAGVLAARPRARFAVGIEGGVEESADGMLAFAWVVVAASDGRRGEARSGAFRLPDAVAELVRAGHELGEADDRIFGRAGSKREEGAIGLLTGGVVDRTALYAHAVTLALVAFRNPRLYSPASSRSK